MNKEMSFEKAIERLSEINSMLEKDEIALDESVALFKEGIELSKFCQKKLDEAKLEIERTEID